VTIYFYAHAGFTSGDDGNLLIGEGKQVFKVILAKLAAATVALPGARGNQH
jgi:hypothetical protein